MKKWLVALLLVLVATPAFAQQAQIKVFRDGYVKIVQVYQAVENEPMEVELYGKPELITVYDEFEEPIYYVLENDTLIFFPLKNGTVTVTYYTYSLTKKVDVFWTFTINLTGRAVITLPSNASIVYINRLPERVSLADHSLEMIVKEGLFNVTYILEVPEKVAEGGQQAEGQEGFDPIYIVGIAIIAIILLVAIFMMKKGSKKEIRSLREEDRAIIEYLKKRGGEAYESEIHRDLLIPRTSAWRAIKRLERLGLVKIEKEGGRNKVVLK